MNFIFYLCGSCVSRAFGVCIIMGMGQVPEKTADDADCPKTYRTDLRQILRVGRTMAVRHSVRLFHRSTAVV